MEGGDVPHQRLEAMTAKGGTTKSGGRAGREEGRKGGTEGGREGRSDDTYLIKLIGSHHGKGRHDQVGRDAHPLLRLLPEIKQTNLVVDTLLQHEGTESEGLVGRHAVSLGQEGNEGHFSRDRLRREGRRGGVCKCSFIFLSPLPPSLPPALSPSLPPYLPTYLPA